MQAHSDAGGAGTPGWLAGALSGGGLEMQLHADAARRKEMAGFVKRMLLCISYIFGRSKYNGHLPHLCADKGARGTSN
jgi:hypothetical protein